MKHFPGPLIDGVEISDCSLFGVLQLQIEDIVLSESHAITDGLIVTGDDIDHTVLGSGLLDGTRSIGACRFAITNRV
jgi:hypothetical protein